MIIKHKTELIIKHKKELIIKHKETKKRSFFLDTKITSDLKVDTKPTGWKQSIAGWKQSIAGWKQSTLVSEVILNHRV